MTIEKAMRGYLDWEIALFNAWREDGTIKFGIYESPT
jgi:hypothetical protein